MTSAPATVEIGRARIEAHADSVSRVCTCFAWSGIADAHSAADVAASAAVLTARWTVPLMRSTCVVALSAILSVAWCAACAAPSNLAPTGLALGLAALLPPVRLPIVVVRSMIGPFDGVTSTQKGQ